jgi:hypothetical protein
MLHYPVVAVAKVYKVFKVYKVSKVYRVYRAYKVFKVNRVYKVFKVLALHGAANGMFLLYTKEMTLYITTAAAGYLNRLIKVKIRHMMEAHIGIKWPVKVFKETLVFKVYKEVKAHLVAKVNKVYKVYKVL